MAGWRAKQEELLKQRLVKQIYDSMRGEDEKLRGDDKFTEK
jgi:hypothetical protein